MKRQPESSLRTSNERMERIESKQRHTRRTLSLHERTLKALDHKVSTLVDQVRQIRNALYMMAFAISCNIPGLKGLAMFVGRLMGL